MNRIEKIAAFILLVACLVVGIVSLSVNKKLGVNYNDTSSFTNVDVSGTLTAGALSSSGATTLSGTTTILNTTKTTLSVGGVNNIGCLAIGSSGSTTTVNYITANGSTLSTTTTKPAGCN